MAWLGPLRQLDFYHLDAVLCGTLGKEFFRKITFAIVTAEIARPDIPDQIALMLKMIAPDAPLSGVVGNAALGGSFVQRQHRSEERRVGQECVSTCRSRWSRYT